MRGYRGFHLLESIVTNLSSIYPTGAKNVTGTVVGAKYGMDVNIIGGGGGGGGSSEVVITDGVNDVGVSNVGGLFALNVRVLELILSYIDDSVSLGANGAIVSDANPLPIKVISQTVVGSITQYAANRIEPAGALSLNIVCDSGSCSVDGGRVLTAGESFSLTAPSGYSLDVFNVTFISGTFTIASVR